MSELLMWLNVYMQQVIPSKVFQPTYTGLLHVNVSGLFSLGSN